MLKKYSKIITVLSFIMDCILISFSFVLSHILSPELDWQYKYAWFLGVYLFLWSIIATRYSLYSSKRTETLISEVIDLIKIIIVDTVLTIFVLVILGFDRIEHIFVILFNSGNIIGLFTSRLLVRSSLRFIRTMGYNFRNILVFGTNERSRRIIKKIVSNSKYGLRILGVVDTKNRKGQQFSYEGHTIIGCIEDFKKILTTHVVDEVYITLPVKSFYIQIEEIIRLCEEQGIGVKVSPNLFHLRVATNTLTFLDNIPMINIRSGSLEIWRLLIKRGIDIIVSFLALMLTLPIFIIVSILIKIDLEGTIFFRQERAGYNMRRFTMLKFRTMVKNAEELKEELQPLNEADGPVFKMKNDPRITRIGRLLRKYSMDELPQLINVLKGDMSLVGPRPPLQSEVNKYNWWQRRRLSMKPGITCLWQVSGRKGISFEEWMRLDLWYIDNWSFQLDIMILLRTILVVLKGTGL